MPEAEPPPRSLGDLAKSLGELAKGQVRALERRRITCPKCQRTSFNPNDIREGFCGWCDDWTTLPPPGEVPVVTVPVGNALPLEIGRCVDLLLVGLAAPDTVDFEAHVSAMSLLHIAIHGALRAISEQDAVAMIRSLVKLRAFR